MNKKRKSGWYGNPYKHSLASQGIKTKLQQFHNNNRNNIPPKELYNIDWNNSSRRSEREKMIKLFWWCSINNNWKWYPFDKFFNETSNFIVSEFFEELLESYFFDKEQEMINYLDYHNMTRKESSDKVFDEIDKKMYYEGIDYDNLDNDVKNRIKEIIQSDSVKDFTWDLWIEIKNTENMNLQEKIQLVDRIIHSQHVHGYMFDIDIPELRKDFEEEYL